MTPQEYAAAQAAINAAASAYVLKFTQFVVDPLLTTAEWLVFLQLIFPHVERARTESAQLARRFVDEQRAIYNPTLPRHDVYLQEYDFKKFVQNMEPTRKKLSQARAPKDAVANVVMHSAREVENAAREQVIKAVQEDYDLLTSDPAQAPEPALKVEKIKERVQQQTKVSIADSEPVATAKDATPASSSIAEELKRHIAETAGKVVEDKKVSPMVKQSGPVRGWARVATGKETCAFCLMLISRGPVYLSAKGAGLDLHDAGAAAAVGDGQDVSQWMNQWHIGCDCKVIPVYDRVDWPGMYAAQRALELWVDASLEARQVLADNPGKKYFSRTDNQWMPTTLNREAINALRRRLDSGEISTQEFSALAAA